MLYHYIKIVILNIFMNWNISFINGAEFLRFGILVLGNHLEGTVSHLGPSFYFMKKKSTKLCFKKW